MAVKITAFEAENVKRIKAVQLEPAPDGLTVIGGANGQGKTSVLDAIAWALGGDRKRPTNARREGSANDPRLKVELSNGIVVERKGKNGALHVTDPSGEKAGQRLLDGLIDQLALDLPRFMAGNDREKADTLLRIIGVGDQLARLEQEQAVLENRRLEVGRIARQKRGAADELPFYADMPADEVGAADLAAAMQAAANTNAENARKRAIVSELQGWIDADNARADALNRAIVEAELRVRDLQSQLADAMSDAAKAESDLAAAIAEASACEDVDTGGIEARMAEVDSVNERIRANKRRAAALADAEDFEEQYKELDAQVEGKRTEKRALLEGADMPLPGLSVDGGALTYNGQPWDGMSGSEQLRVATAIVRKLKPECGFVLVDKLEQLDGETLREFGEWAAAEGLQVIGTRVAADDTCTVIIEDGYAVGGGAEPEAPAFNYPGMEA